MNRETLVAFDRVRTFTASELRDDDAELLGDASDAVSDAVEEGWIAHLEGASGQLREAAAGAGPLGASLGDDPTLVRARFVEAVRATGASDELVDEATSAVDSYAFDSVVRDDLPIETNPALRPAIERGRLMRLGAIDDLGVAKLNALMVRAGVSTDSIDAHVLDTAVADGELTEREADRLGLSLALERLLDGQPALVEAVRTRQSAAARLPAAARVSSAAELAGLDAATWARKIRASGVEPAGGLSVDDYARVLAKRVEVLYPTDTFMRRLPVVPNTAGAGTKRRLAPVVRAHPGLGLGAVLDDDQLSDAERLQTVRMRVDEYDAFVRDNADIELLAHDLTAGSRDLDNVDFGGLDDDGRARVLRNLRAHQRGVALANDVDNGAKLVSAGYHSAMAIVAAGEHAFVHSSGLSEADAEAVYASASAATAGSAGAAMTIFEVMADRFTPIPIGEIPDLDDYLRRIDGFADLFGNQDYCHCEHCNAIWGPPAYFVDLMLFVEDEITSRTFTGARADHPLALHSRRPDLWTLPLTCANTDRVIPQLQIVNRIFEDRIAKARNFAGDFDDRKAVEAAVYDGYLAGLVWSFRLPLSLPLARVYAYLRETQTPRSDIVEVVTAADERRSAARLSLSRREWQLVTQPDAHIGRLSAVFNIAFQLAGGGPAITPFDAGDLVDALGVTRAELTALLTSAFVTANGNEAPTVVSERRDPNSVQNDVERVNRLRTSTLDRLHRFVRLWRALGGAWTIRELDLVLATLAGAGRPVVDENAVVTVTRLRELQSRLAFDLSDAVAMVSGVPDMPAVDGGTSRFDERFNLEAFVGADGAYPQPGTSFLHPDLALVPTANGAAIARRLQAACGVGAGELLDLVVALAPALGIDPQAPADAGRSFDLDRANLTLLYRHARLGRALRMKPAALGELLALVPGLANGAVESLDDLDATVTLATWMREQRVTARSLATMTDAPGATMPLDAPTAAADVVSRAGRDRALHFTDTVFTAAGCTEDDSRAVVAANAAVFVADTTTPGQPPSYHLAPGVDLNVALTIPASVTVAEPPLRDVLRPFDPARVAHAYLAMVLRVEPDKLASLVTAASLDLASVAVADELLATVSPPATLTAAIDALQPLIEAFRPSAFTASAVSFIAANAALVGIADPTHLDTVAIRSLRTYQEYASDETRRADLHALLAAYDPATRFAGADPAAAARLLDIPVGLWNSVQAALVAAPDALADLEVHRRACELAQRVGVSGDGLALVASDTDAQLRAGADALLGGLRSRYRDDAEFARRMAPVEGEVLERRRDALVDAIVRDPASPWAYPDELSDHFLIDVSVGGCFEVAPLVAAISSVQLYVHRVLMNLEQDRSGAVAVSPSLPHRQEWEEFRKNYRKWEVFRKVAINPSPYIFPELRDDKTPLFKALEADLLQKDIDTQAVLDAYSTYLEGLDELSRLEIAGSYHDRTSTDGDVLHLFGVTASEPPTYYYRSAENLEQETVRSDRTVVWSPWEKVDVRIPVRRVAPFVHDGRLYVFWVEITTSPQNVIVNGSSEFVGYRHKLTVKFTTLRLDGQWSPPHELDLYGVPPFQESSGVVDDPLLDQGETLQVGTPGVFTIDVPKVEAFIPRYDTVVHSKARDGYTLRGPEWEAVYPEETPSGVIFTGAGYQMRAGVDMFRRRPFDSTGYARLGRVAFTFNDFQPSPTIARKQDAIYGGSARLTLWDNYAAAALLSDPDALGRVLKDQPNVATMLTKDLYKVKLAEAPNTSLAVINGNVTSAILDRAGDLLLLRPGASSSSASWRLERIGTTLTQAIARRLFTRGVDGVLDLSFQQSLREAAPPVTLTNVVEDGVVQGRIDFTGPSGVYYRELLCHIPFLLGNFCNSQGMYEEANRWYSFIFDPTSPEVIPDDPTLSAVQNAARKADRNWRYLEFRGRTVESLRDVLTDHKAIAAYRRNPFNPNAVARMRIDALQKAVVLRWADNMLDWADDDFTQFQMEPVNEALMKYRTVAAVISPRPRDLGDCGEMRGDERTYEKLRPHLDGNEFLVELEQYSLVRTDAIAPWKTKRYGNELLAPGVVALAQRKAARLPALADLAVFDTGSAARARVVDETAPRAGHGEAVGGSNVSTYPIRAGGWKEGFDFAGLERGRHRFGWSIVRQLTPAFCIPPDATLLDYWKRLEDRLHKIRNCMDINGVKRALAQFAPETDPMLLVRATAAGIDIGDVLDAVTGEVPPYKFTPLLERAKSATATVQAYAASLQAAFERKDAEQLARLQQTHQRQLLQLATQSREYERDAAAAAVDALVNRQTALVNRRRYYETLRGQGLNGFEWTQRVFQHVESSTRMVESVMGFAAAVASFVPDVGAPFAMKYGGLHVGNGLERFKVATGAIGDFSGAMATSADLEAGWARRDQGWEHEVDTADDELAVVSKEHEAARLRLQIAQRALETHQRTLEQYEEMLTFVEDKFTGLGLYTWLCGNGQWLLREGFHGAYALAKMAERAFQYERDDPTPRLAPGFWDAGHAGLNAGAQLMIALQAMERRFLETDTRDLEIDQPFALSQIDPKALMQLKLSGECEFEIPEWAFDLFYPGQYRRRIKALRLTIPCVTGPYTNVSATLTLLGSSIRRTPDAAAAALSDIPVSRTDSVATSSGQSDAGVFELQFRDEKYLPFEGAGALSRWRLTLPRNFQPFDYNTINDVLVQLSYTALWDGALADRVESTNAGLEGALAKALADVPSRRLFSMRQEFSPEFTRLLRSPVDTDVSIAITERHLPSYVTGGSRSVTIDEAVLLLRTVDGLDPGAFSLSVNGTDVSGFAADPEFQGVYSTDVTAALGSVFADHVISITDADVLAPAAPTPGDVSAVDGELLADMALSVSYTVA